MALTRRLVKHGNSYALVIPKPILDLLDIDEHTPLLVTISYRRMSFTPLRRGATLDPGGDSAGDPGRGRSPRPGNRRKTRRKHRRKPR